MLFSARRLLIPGLALTLTFIGLVQYISKQSSHSFTFPNNQPPQDASATTSDIPITNAQEQNVIDTTSIEGANITVHENESFKHPHTPIYTRQCSVISPHVLHSLVEKVVGAQAPSVYHLHRGQILGSNAQQSHLFNVGAEFCSIFICPQSPPPTLAPGDFQNLPINGWGPDAIHAEIGSSDVRLMFEQPEFWGYHMNTERIVALYMVGYGLYHPGDYQIEAEIEYEHYDWVMEDPTATRDMPFLRYEMKDITISPGSPAITITGTPAARPIVNCYDGQPSENGDLRGRWYLASSFNKDGNQTALNSAARLEFADHDNTIDEWGWMFAPDHCNLLYFSSSDHAEALANRSIDMIGDSNSRRLMKSLIGGSDTWCLSPDDLSCQCQDNKEKSLTDMLGTKISIENMIEWTARDEPIVFGQNTTLWHDYVGGLITHPFGNEWRSYLTSFWGPTVLQQRAQTSSPPDIVHLSLLGWDLRVIKTPSEMLSRLHSFRETFLNAFPQQTNIVTRLANAPCCGTEFLHARYNQPRIAMWNEMWRRFWKEDERAGRMRVYDAGVLNGRKEAMKRLPCWMTHMRGSHVRLEAMMWMNAMATKVVGKDGRVEARLRGGLGLEGGESVVDGGE